MGATAAGGGQCWLSSVTKKIAGLAAVSTKPGQVQSYCPHELFGIDDTTIQRERRRPGHSRHGMRTRTGMLDGPFAMTFDLTLLVRIVIGAVLGFAMGWEREARGSEAGDRTFALVSLGAAAFTAAGVEHFPATAEKVMAGIVTGVGFLGGGMILREGGAVRGLTTAAALWATAAVGMLAGIGELLIAGLVAALTIFILEIPYIPGLRRFDARHRRPTTNNRERSEPQ